MPEGEGYTPDEVKREVEESKNEEETSETGVEQLGEVYLEQAEAEETASREKLDADAQKFFNVTKLKHWAKGIGGVLYGAAGVAGYGASIYLGSEYQAGRDLSDPSGFGLMFLSSVGAMVAGGIIALKAREKLYALEHLKAVREHSGEDAYRERREEKEY